jgi:hypothetical protein
MKKKMPMKKKAMMPMGESMADTMARKMAGPKPKKKATKS